MSIITIQPKSITTNFNWHVNYGDLDIEAYDANINFLGSGGLNYIILNSQNNNFIRTASAGIEMYTNAGWDNRRMIRLVELKGMINNETKTFYSKSYSNRKYSKGEEFYEYFSWQFGFKEENILIEDLTLYIHTNAQSVSDDCGVKINYGNLQNMN